MAVRTSRAGLPARPRLLTPVIVAVLLVLVLGGIGVSLYTDLLWFRSVGKSTVFTTVLFTKLGLFVGFGVLMAVVVGANASIAYRVRPPFRPMSLEQQNLERYRVGVEPYLLPVLLGGAGLFGLFAGLSAASRWQTWLLWRNATPFGVADAQFGRDVSYFAMTYPFQRFVLGFLLTAVVLSALVAAATHYLFGGLRLQTAGEKVSPAARAHLSVLVGVVVLLKAVAYYLDRFGLAFSTRGVVQGASYTDVNAVLPAKNILIAVAVLCSLLFFANIVVRNILLPAGALALLVLSAVVLGGLFPAYTQQFRVKPNEIDREAQYITRNIAATRQAYGIADTEVRPYEAQQTTSPAELDSDTGTIPNARLLDPTVLAPTFEQLQRFRNYFGVTNRLDIDRYPVDGKVQDFIVAARELDQTQLQPNQRNWINQRLIYTHGNGIIAAPANQVDSEGKPIFTVGNVPPSGPGGAPLPFPIDQARIYFGELSPSYSVVNTDQGEIDGPAVGDEQITFRYDGDGGVQLSSAVRKVAYALKFREPNLLLSGSINPDSRLMYDREPRDRVKKVAPFLQLDSDPYPAVVDGRVLWIVDGYTTSAGYPYAEQRIFGDVTRDSTGPTRAAAAAGQLHPQLGQGHGRRLHRQGHPLPLRRPRPGARDLGEGLPGHDRGVVGDHRRAALALPLPGGPVQGAARAAHAVPRAGLAGVLQQGGLLAGTGGPCGGGQPHRGQRRRHAAGRGRRAGDPGAGGAHVRHRGPAAVLRAAAVPGSARAALLAVDVVRGEQRRQPRRLRLGELR